MTHLVWVCGEGVFQLGVHFGKIVISHSLLFWVVFQVLS
jgi:hypothetical protein